MLIPRGFGLESILQMPFDPSIEKEFDDLTRIVRSNILLNFIILNLIK